MGVRGYAPETLLVRVPAPSAVPDATEPDPSLTRTMVPVWPRTLASLPVPSAGRESAPEESESAGSATMAPPEAQDVLEAVCAEALTIAQAAYTEGQFERAVESVSRCTSADAPPAELGIPAQRLLALAYLYLGRPDDARLALVRLLEHAPDYEPDRLHDLPAYRALVSEVKRALGLPDAGSQCDVELAEAEVRYREGAFEQVLGKLETCLGKPALIDDEVTQAYRLAILTHLKQGDLTAAREAAAHLLRRVPAYRPTPDLDLPVYVSLVEVVRRQLEADTAP